jgi:meso-butanediol dehydrogenase / (S,S)-butanediol dehydrogenase / diacetyl reductase
MGRFDDRVAVITGGGSGIGRAVAERFCREGGRVALVGRTPAKLDRVAAELGAERALVLPGAHEDPAHAAHVAEQTVQRWGRIDALFNNGGTFDPATVADTTDAAWATTLAANLTGPFVMSRAVLAPMRAAGHGVVIHTASTLGLKPIPGAAAYSVAKAGLIMLGKAMAIEEAGHGIRVLTVCPGVVDTPIHRQRPGIVDDAAQRAFLGEIAPVHLLGRVGTPEEVASLMLHLASDESSWMTGSVVPIEGGTVLT